MFICLLRVSRPRKSTTAPTAHNSHGLPSYCNLYQASVSFQSMLRSQHGVEQQQQIFIYRWRVHGVTCSRAQQSLYHCFCFPFAFGVSLFFTLGAFVGTGGERRNKKENCLRAGWGFTTIQNHYYHLLYNARWVMAFRATFVFPL